MSEPFIRFDMEKINNLKTNYESVIEFILNDLPKDVNWNSSKAIVEYFNSELDIQIPNAKISTIAALMPRFDETTYQFEIITGVTFYLKLKYSLKNYIGCIIRHNINGIVTLRVEDGNLVMPNKRPLPTAPEITECIIARHQPYGG